MGGEKTALVGAGEVLGPKGGRWEALRVPAAIMEGSEEAMEAVEAAGRKIAALRAQWAIAGLAAIFERHPSLTGVAVGMVWDRNDDYSLPDIHTNKFTNHERSMARPLGSDAIGLDADAMEQPRRRGKAEGPHAALIEDLEAWAKSAARRGGLAEMAGGAYKRPERDGVLPSLMRQGLSSADYAGWEAEWLMRKSPKMAEQRSARRTAL